MSFGITRVGRKSEGAVDPFGLLSWTDIQPATSQCDPHPPIPLLSYLSTRTAGPARKRRWWKASGSLPRASGSATARYSSRSITRVKSP
ncbi:hypothetical protein APY03_1337 [Variovorax sp. WDL1]|nr:hypothetical protein APY03_1337 [Variovorax sp. WDL1]